MNGYSNKETYHASLWLNKTEEFYIRVCKKIGLKESRIVVAETIKELMNKIIAEHNNNIGSVYAMYMIEAVGDFSQIKYNELADNFLDIR